MAGSYDHIHREDGGLSLIENMGDAAECIEELYYLVRVLGTDEQIERALQEFYRQCRAEPSDSPACIRAFQETRAMLDR